MALSRIWSAFIIIAIVLACIKGFVFPDRGNKNIFTNMVIGKAGDTIRVKSVDSAMVDANIVAAIIAKKIDTTNGISTFKNGSGKYVSYKIQTANGVVDTCKSAVELCIGLIGLLAVFMGFLAIAEQAGGINLLSRIIGPFFSKIFPDVPKGHPAVGHMMMNFSANLLGLDNAATPFGIKAMEEMDRLNKNKGTASNDMALFLVLNAACIQFVPTTIIAVRVACRSESPGIIILPAIVSTGTAALTGIVCAKILQRYF